MKRISGGTLPYAIRYKYRIVYNGSPFRHGAYIYFYQFNSNMLEPGKIGMSAASSIIELCSPGPCARFIVRLKL
jgi:hypothetical protein